MKKNLFFLFILITGFSGLRAQIFYKDVAGIFYARCTSCHHPGANDYSWMNYTSVSSATALIQYDLNNNIMPPWKADTSYTRFQHERLISASEKNQILNWIAGGSLKGDTTQAPPAPTYTTNYVLQGVPDAEIKMPVFTSTATTNDIYVCIAIPSGLTQDRYIRAFEIVPGNKPIVHHAIIAADTTGTYTSDYSGTCYNIPGNLVIGTYAPGTQATVFPNSSALRAGIKLKAGSKIIMQMHYPKGSSGQMDSTKIRIYYYPTGTPNIRPIYVTTPLQNWSFYLPANQTTTVTAYYPTSGTLSSPISAFAVFPHSHLLGKSMLNYALVPNVDTIPLINIPEWDFEWQDYYVYRKLVKIPAGYRLFSKHVFDNTTSNPNNPSNPPVGVFPGTGTKDEMFFDGMMWMNYQAGDENINMDSIMKADTLYWSGVKELDKEAIVSAMAYPNPFSDNISIRYVLKENADVAFEFSDITGRMIYEQKLGKKEQGRHEYTWKAKNATGQSLPDGIYFYQIKVNDQSYKGKLIRQN